MQGQRLKPAAICSVLMLLAMAGCANRPSEQNGCTADNAQQLSIWWGQQVADKEHEFSCVNLANPG
ncbi:hypothetical protein GW590_00675 [Rahnella sp. SAP-1]|uniref:Type III secretion protein n=1 Tax=Rouxiella aceris TaxID=2703884 RepID=A0A848MCJ0_9GAMM|nr:hypothetical protein [Rouxiella aceris]NMP25405.1 hypothetical protein [Rouxiella aceris]